jgi:tetratricopeptide (TPR) repeat protein
MIEINPDQPLDLQQRKTIGRNYLSANRVKEGLEVFAAILKDYPEDIETLLVLGDLYLGSGDESTALQLYATALKIDPARADTIERIQLAVPENVGEAVRPAEEVPNDPEAINRLLQRLSGRQSPINEVEIQRAAELLNTIVSSSNPADMVSQHLEEIDALLPALIELNIRQANSDGRPDLANALMNLQMNINLQIQSAKGFSKPRSPSSNAARLRSLASRSQWKVLILVPDTREIPTRITTVAEALNESGCRVSIASAYRASPDDKPDVGSYK